MKPDSSILSLNYIFYLIIFLLSIFPLSLTEESSCIEQWSELDTSFDNWSKKGDITIPESSNGTPIFTFGEKKMLNFTGVAWLNLDLSKKRGLAITFKPELIKYKTSSSSYPNGFAIIITPSDIEYLIRGKNEGFYNEGIYNGISFEFGFTKNKEKGNLEKAYFSVNYIINGVLNVNSKERKNNLCNIELPNFYDEEKTDFDNNMFFEIKILGKKLILKSKSITDTILFDSEFSEFQELLEKENCRLVLTSPVNENWEIILKNFKLEEISMNKKGFLEIENHGNDVQKVKAGEKITFYFYITSLCGEKLRIFLNEINNNDFKLQINEQNIKPHEITFDKELMKLKIIFSLSVAKLYTAIVEFKEYTSYPLQFIVVPNDEPRLELCEHGSSEEDKYYTTSILDQVKDYFYIPICSYDYLGNIKDISVENIKGTKIKYPLNIIPNENIEFKEDKVNKRLLLKIYFTNFGTYEIFNENFINKKIRYVNLKPKYISPDKSKVSILFEKNIIQSDTNKIYLRIKTRDDYDRDISSITLKELNCDFSKSEVVLNSDNVSNNILTVSTEYKDDYVILSVDKPLNKGTYLFIPKVQCTNINLIQLTCGIDSITKINNCEFFNPTEEINTNKIKLYDEASDEYITYEKGVTSSDFLYISLDEKENKKISEIILLDEEGSNYLSNTVHTIAATLNSEALTVTQIGYKYSLILPQDKTRHNYTPIRTYQLKIILNSISEFIINVKFYFLDKYMTNVDITQNDISKITYIAFFKQNSFILEAQETLLLFEIYELSEGKYLGNIDTLLDASKVTMEINSVLSTQCDIINHNNFFLSVISHDFTKAGQYMISLKYDGNEILNIDLIINSNSVPFFLSDENGNRLGDEAIIEVERDNLVKLFMLDKYENIINDNRIFKAFAEIKISDNDIFYIKPNYDGKINIFNQGIIMGRSVTLTLINGQTYIIESIYNPNFEEHLDPLNSFGILSNESPNMEDNSDIKLSLHLKDKYGNYLSGEVDKDKINVYIEGKNLIEIIKMDTDETTLTEGIINYKANFGKIGDYFIKIFIKNLPIECRGCHFRKNYVEIEDYTKTSLYILSNKQKIQILNSYSLSRKRVALVNKNNFFSFYLDQRDQYLNEIRKENNVNSIILNFISENAGIDTSSITFCETEKGYYELCKNVLESWKQLSDGIYLITNSELKYKFYIYLTNTPTDSINLTPKIDNSYIHSRDLIFYGKLDIPTSFVLDIRNSDYKRIKGLDKSKITLYSKNLKNIAITTTEGNEEGLFIVFLRAQVPGTYTFNIRYNNANIINDVVTYKCSCGTDLVLKPKGSEYNYNGNYAFFNFIDSNRNECNLPFNWNLMNEKNFANYILKATIDNGNNYKTETYYNHITNTLIIFLENYVTEYVNFYSNVFKFYWDEEYITTSLVENIIDENHFYASISKEENILTIKSLNANYEPAFNCEILDFESFSVSLIRIINDDFIILKTDFEIIDDFCEFSIELDDTLLDAKGKYLYVVYYQGKELFCDNCMINNDINVIEISKSKVYHKEGDFNYYQNDENMILPIFKTNLPFFKINIMSEKNNLVILDSGLNIELKALIHNTEVDSIILDSNIKYSSNGNIYIYLTAEGRSKFWNLAAMTKIQLSISLIGDDSSTFIANYFAMDHYVKKISSNENCDISKDTQKI